MTALRTHWQKIQQSIWLLGAVLCLLAALIFWAVTDREELVEIEKQPESEIELQIHFYDQYHLLKRVAPEVAKPYFQLCNQLLMRASNSLFNSSNNVLNRYIKDVYIKDNSHYNA